jgi:molybdenum cofactor biosynthesis enzyme MoaA
MMTTEPATPPTINLNVHNFESWRLKPHQPLAGIRFDANNDCNIHCVYCHIPRSKDLIDFDDFKAFPDEKVDSIDLFQFGCQMEPTLDKRLVRFMQAVADSPARPRKTLRLQTNGILLHRHDRDEMRAAGLNLLTVSVDAADPAVVKKLRGGTSLSKVLNNVREFHEACPTVRLVFVTTVTEANIDGIDQLVASGLDVGVTTFNLRQVSYQPNNIIVGHTQMPSLVVSNDRFSEMVERVTAKYSTQARFMIQGLDSLSQRARTVRAASGLLASGSGSIAAIQDSAQLS